MNIIGIIPARYASTRLMGKPLIHIHGKPMIQWVYEGVAKILKNVYVATDDVRIEKAVKGFGGNTIMTSINHTNGTSRCLEAAKIIQEQISEKIDIIINIQGDEPLIKENHIEKLIEAFTEGTEMTTLITPVKEIKDLVNESEVFVTFDKNNNALYFSRSVIPYVRGIKKDFWLDHAAIYKHIGLYAYTMKALEDFNDYEHTDLETVESLEQNRWIENGRKIKVAITNYESYPVDTEEDLDKVRNLMQDFK